MNSALNPILRLSVTRRSVLLLDSFASGLIKAFLGPKRDGILSPQGAGRPILSEAIVVSENLIAW